MPQLATKYNERTITYNNFSGGINLIDSPESIADNEVVQAENFEFDFVTGSLKTVGGAEMVYQASNNIDELWYDALHDKFLYSMAGVLCSTDLISETVVGALSGTKKPIFDLFNNKTLIASGGYLQAYDGVTLTTITATKPNSTDPLYCDFVKNRDSRALITMTGDDNIYYSHQANHTNWAFATGTGNELAAKYYEVGYLDMADIVGVRAIASDLLVFKRNAKKTISEVFKLTGFCPNLTVTKVSENADCANHNSVVQAINDVYFVGDEGFKSMRTVVDYGSIKSADAGKKVNPFLVRNSVSGKQRIWHIPERQQLWIKASDDGYVYIYHYAIGAFTVRRFTTGSISGLTTKDNVVYIAIGKKILRLNDEIATEDGVSTQSTLVPKRLVSTEDFVIHKLGIDSYNSGIGTGVLQVSGISLPLVLSTGDSDIYGDMADIYGDITDIFELPTNRANSRYNHRTDTIQPRLTLNSGGLSVRGIFITVSDAMGG